jgi:hypothetical protein
MTYRGHIENGVVVLDDAADLPEGAQVRIEPVELAPRVTLAQKFKDVIGSVTDLPPDMAEQHDHYIHGTPKE